MSWEKMLGIADANNPTDTQACFSTTLMVNLSILTARRAAIYCGRAGAWLTSPTFLNWKSPNFEQQL
jgi:hypothetical protein